MSDNCPDGPGTVRGMFDPAALQQAVTRHLADVPIPEDKKGVFLTVGNQHGVKAVVAVRVGDAWQVGAFVDVAKDPDELWSTEYGVVVKATF